VNGLAGCTSNCAHRERFGRLFRSTIVACGYTLFNDLHLAVESRGATLNQWHISCQTHLVHVSPGLEVVQSIKSDAELLEPCHGKLVIFDVGVVRDDFDARVESLCRFLGYLYACEYSTSLQVSREDDALVLLTS